MSDDVEPKHKKRNGFNAPHPNSILAKISDDPVERAKYEDWRAEVVGDEAAIKRWARNDFQSTPGSEVSTVRVRSRSRKAK